MDAIRNGNFTSSEIVALLACGTREMTDAEKKLRPAKGKGSSITKVEDENSLGEAAWTYILECNMERKLGRSLTDESSARPLSWGKLLENRVHEIIGTEYKLCSQETLTHPDFDCWKGSPDFIKFLDHKYICDAKCPLTLKSFCQLVDAWYEGFRGNDFINAFRFGFTDKNGAFHKPNQYADKYYWQLVSNACIAGCDHAELIVYCPYKSELSEIKSLSEGDPKCYWIWSADESELPHLIEGGHYKNVNVMDFEIPEQDKKFLAHRVAVGSKHLIEIPSLILN